LVARLGERCHGADLDVAEAETPQPVDAGGVLVETGGDAERRLEAQTHRLDGEGGRGTGHGPGERGETGETEHPDDREGEGVRALGVEPRQEDAEEEAIHAFASLAGDGGQEVSAVSVASCSTLRRVMADSKSSRESKPW